MVNKSMMHTHASGCHKRRSLPAHSLAAAGLSLLLAFSCPFAVRADTNLSAEEAIDSFYEKNVPNNIGNSNNFDDYTWIKNVPLNRTNEATYGLQVFDSIAEACRYYNIKTQAGVSMCCRGKRKSCGKLDDGTKLVWMFYNDYIKLTDNEKENKIKCVKNNNYQNMLFV